MKTREVNELKKYILIFLFLIPSLCLAVDLTPGEKRKIEGDVADSFNEIVGFWRAGKFEDLYECGFLSSHSMISKESFVRQMKNKYYVIASSWEAIRDVEINVVSLTSAYVRVKIGFKSRHGGDTKFSK